MKPIAIALVIASITPLTGTSSGGQPDREPAATRFHQPRDHQLQWMVLGGCAALILIPTLIAGTVIGITTLAQKRYNR